MDSYSKHLKLILNKERRISNLTAQIMSSMARIESQHKKTFTEIDAQLESDIFKAIDNKNIAQLHSVIKRLDAAA